MFMIPWLAGAAALFAVTSIAYLLRSRNRKAERALSQKLQSFSKDIEDWQSEYSEKMRKHNSLLEQINALRKASESGEISTSSVSGQQSTLPEKFSALQGIWQSLIEIVHHISFSQRPVTVPRKIGEEIRESNFPTDETEIMQIRGLHEIMKVLPSNLISDDSLFYASAATNSLLKQQPMERIDVFEDERFSRRKSLRVLQDVSTSTSGQRIAWSKVLDSLLVDKAKKSRAEFWITTFNHVVGPSASAVVLEEWSYAQVRPFIEEQVFAHGETNINKALIHELELIQKENADRAIKPSTQIVLITDRTEGINENLITKLLKDNNATLHTVVLGEKNDTLQRVSSKYHFLNISSD